MIFLYSRKIFSTFKNLNYFVTMKNIDVNWELILPPIPVTGGYVSFFGSILKTEGCLVFEMIIG